MKKSGDITTVKHWSPLPEEEHQAIQEVYSKVTPLSSVCNITSRTMAQGHNLQKSQGTLR